MVPQLDFLFVGAAWMLLLVLLGCCCWCRLDAAAGAAWVLLLVLLVGGGDEVCGVLRLDTTQILGKDNDEQ